MVYIRQHQSSSMSVLDVESYVKDIGDQRFMDSESQSGDSPLKHKDKVLYSPILEKLQPPHV